MKKNSTINAWLCMFMIVAFLPVTAQTNSQYNFNAAPVLLSGTANQVNARYLFANVSVGVDAIVTIVSSANGATVDIFDDNTITKPEGFSPKIMVPARTTGFVEFQVCFVTAGTTNSMLQDSLYATAIDIDGNAQIREMDIIDMNGGVSSFQADNPEISVTQTGTTFTGLNITGNEYDGIDTAAKKVMFTVKNSNVGCFTYKCGASNTGNSAVSRQKSIYFKNFTYPPVAAPLPVKYLSFNAVSAEKAVNLTWVTVSEMNNSHFEVERSFDRNAFTSIGIVLDGFVSENNNKTYAFRDKTAGIEKKQVVYYRLKQIDLDGRINYSEILAVRFENKTTAKMQVSPNPFKNDITVRFNATAAGPGEMRVVNISGQPVMTQKLVLGKGMNNIQVNGLEKLLPGMYMVQLMVEGVLVETQKVIKS